MKNKSIIRIIIIVLGALALTFTAIILFSENSIAPVGDDIQDQFDAEETDCKRAANAYVDMKEEEAVAKAENENRNPRIAEKDGVGLPLTEDFSPSRLNFTIQDGVVTKAECY